MSQCCPNHTSHDEAAVVSLVGVARCKHLKIILWSAAGKATFSNVSSHACVSYRVCPPVQGLKS